MNEKTTIRFVLTGVKYSQSDLGKHYKTFCGLYTYRIVLSGGTGTGRKRSRSAYSSKWNDSLTAWFFKRKWLWQPLICARVRARIYYIVSLFSSLSPFCWRSKKICSSTCLSISVLRKSFHLPCKKSPYIFGLYVIKSYFCTRFREREQRCFDILTGTA